MKKTRSSKSKRPSLGSDPFDDSPEERPAKKPEARDPLEPRYEPTDAKKAPLKKETPPDHAHDREFAREAITEDFEATRKTLDQLGEELDAFHEDPRGYDRKRLEPVVKEFVYELKAILADSGYFARIQESLQPEKPGWGDFLKRARLFFRSEDVDEYGLDRRFELAIKPFFDFLYYKYFRVSVKGVENIPYEGRALMVSNHSGVIPLDGSMLKVALFNEHPSQRELRFLVDDFVFHFPFLGTIMNRIGGVRACPENAERLLRSGEVVSVFPEGIKGISKLFKDRYNLERFGRGGVIRLALRTKSPIIPTCVVGAEEIYPLLYKSHVLARPLGLPFIPITPLFPFLGPLGAVPLPTKWSIQFGKPIPFDQYNSNDINDGILINRETENLRSVIQDMIKKALEERRSIFGS